MDFKLSKSAYLPVREPVGDAMEFTVKYLLKKNDETGNRLSRTYKSNMIYYCNDDAVVFPQSSTGTDGFESDEVRYRNNLRQRLDEMLGFTLKLRNWNMLDEHLNTGKTAEEQNNSFIRKKMNRYKSFMKCITNFALESIHDMIWTDFNRLIPTGLPITMILEKVIPIVTKLKDMFEEELDKEYNTDELEKLIGLGGQKASISDGAIKIKKPRKKAT